MPSLKPHQPTEKYDTHPNKHLAEGEKVVYIDKDESDIWGTVVGFEGEDRVWVEWPYSFTQEDVSDLIGFSEHFDVARGHTDKTGNLIAKKAPKMRKRLTRKAMLPEFEDGTKGDLRKVLEEKEDMSPLKDVPDQDEVVDEGEEIALASPLGSLSEFLQDGDADKTRKAAISRLAKMASFLHALARPQASKLAKEVSEIAEALDVAGRQASKGVSVGATREGMRKAVVLSKVVPASMREAIENTCVQAFIYKR